MRFVVLGLAMLLSVASCSPYQPPPPPELSVTTAYPPPVTGTVVVQPQP